MKPKITVLMPVYNAHKYLKEAMDSILNQTFKDFIFLIINDGSTDDSREIINSYQDDRVKLIDNDKNMGIVYTLNKGLELAKTEFIARMDSDDISLPKRLYKQIIFMKKNSKVGVCGGAIKFFGATTKTKIFSKKNESIKAGLLFTSQLAHPSVMMRTEMLKKHNLFYDSKYEYVEDYKLWTDCVDYFDLANLGNILILYRTHHESISSIKRKNQKAKVSNIVTKLCEKNLGFKPSQEELRVHNLIQEEIPNDLDANLMKLGDWLNKILAQNKVAKCYKEHDLNYFIAKFWLETCSYNTEFNNIAWRNYWKKKLRQNLSFTYCKMFLKFFMKSLCYTIKRLM